jgi:hypothetical protein
VALERGFDGADPVRAPDGTHEVERRLDRSTHVATGTLACPGCDAPVAPAAGGMSPADRIACPFCATTGHVRDFLSLAEPTRPARVVIRVVGRVPRVLRDER